MIHIRVVKTKAVLPRGRTDDLDVLPGHVADALLGVDETDETVVLAARETEPSPVLIKACLGPAEGKRLVPNGIDLVDG